MRAARPEISVRAESGLEPELMQGLIEGRIDIGVMYTPQNRPGLKLEQLFEEKLVMVSTDPKGSRSLNPAMCMWIGDPNSMRSTAPVFRILAGLP